MTVIRRGFHTLKGSARMVGLREFGEAAWACEQLYNARLAQSGVVDSAMQQFTAEALAYLGGWTEAIAHGDGMLGSYNAADVATAADALRVEGVLVPIAALGALHGGAQSAPVAPQAAVAHPGATNMATNMAASMAASAAALAGFAGLAAAAPAGVDLLLDGPATAPLPEPEPVTTTVQATLQATLHAPLHGSQHASQHAPLHAPQHAPTQSLDLRGFESPTLPAVFTGEAGLQQRVPDLPSAADLDLSAAIPGDKTALTTPAPAPTAGADAEVTRFEFDWDSEDSAAAASTPADTPADTPATTSAALLGLMPPRPPREASAPTAGLPPATGAVPQAETQELDFDEMGALFGAELASDPAATAVPAAPAADLSLLTLLETADPSALVPATPALIAGLGVLAYDGDTPPAVPPHAALPPSVLPALLPEEEPEEEPFKAVGPLRISIPLFNIFLNEADELSRHLVTQMAEWTLEQDTQPVPDTSVALAHSLAGNAATVGAADLSALARSLEHALMRSHTVGYGRPDEAALFTDAAEEIRRLLHQFAAGFLREVPLELTARLIDHEHWPVPDTGREGPITLGLSSGHAPLLDVPTSRAAAPAAAPMPMPFTAAESPIDVADAIDPELFPIFEEEAEELLPELQARLADWLDEPADASKPASCMRSLHTFKGGARLAGAMRLGEMAHRLEAAIETLAAYPHLRAADVEPLLARGDTMVATFEALRRASTPAPVPAAAAAITEAPVTQQPVAELPVLHPSVSTEALDIDLGFDAGPAPAMPLLAVPSTTVPDSAVPAAVAALAAAAAAAWAGSVAANAVTAPAPVPVPAPPATPAPAPTPAPIAQAPALPVAIDWSRFPSDTVVAPATTDDGAPEPSLVPTGNAVVRVRASLLDRLVNQAGEVSITRSRIGADVKQLQGMLADLHDSLDRMRTQLRDLELQAETQMSSRLEAAKAASQGFDPLEMDRFTRFQEQTRFMAESVNDVATLQRSLQRTLQTTEDELAAQTRLTRELQEDLLRTRMVEFDSTTDRLSRTVRQAAKDSGKQARLDLVGGGIEVDRGVLERMVGPFEHLLRNCVAHGIELPAERERLGKDATGQVTVTVSQSGNEVTVEFADDGAGLDLPRIRQRAVQRGLLAADAGAAATTDAALAQLIFEPGFSTADSITALAGRGVGLDVVRADVMAMGGRVQTESATGRGTRITLLLPLTTAVTQVVMLRCGETQVAVPSTLVEVVRRVPSTEVAASYTSGQHLFQGNVLPFFWLTALLRSGSRGHTDGKTQTVVVVRSAAQRVAVHVDEVVGNQEVVVKNVGPQLARVPGLAGVTLLASGAVAYIYNPVALANVYGPQARALMQTGAPAASSAADMAAGAATGAATGAASVPQLGLPLAAAGPTTSTAPLVMVVDDSITVRRVTQRLLVREGYRVVTAKDGMDALERLVQLQPQRPVVMLSDIEMPRMDGFDLLRHVRADAQLASLPVVMITSRSAQKHRDHAAELGADHYLGKPYAEDELLALVARYAQGEVRAALLAP
jgi:chemosensory pili system protein ChpA (sensor histidine kinase/response regulator)